MLKGGIYHCDSVLQFNHLTHYGVFQLDYKLVCACTKQNTLKVSCRYKLSSKCFEENTLGSRRPHALLITSTKREEKMYYYFLSLSLPLLPPLPTFKYSVNLFIKSKKCSPLLMLPGRASCRTSSGNTIK